MPDWKDNVHFVLVEPREQGNIGASARAMKNMGFSRLSMVNPPELAKEARWLAHLSTDVLDGARSFGSIGEAVGGMGLVLGTTRRKGRRRGVSGAFEEGMGKAFEAAQNNQVAILFGRENKGLFNEEIEECDFLVSIPANPAHPSLNLSHAVMVAAYELCRAESGGPKGAGRVMVTHGDLDLLFGRFEELAKLLEFPVRGSRDLERNTIVMLRRLVRRAVVSKAELDMLHGICTQMEKLLRKG